MPEVSFTGVFVVCAAAFAAPFVLGLFPRVRLPSVVLEIMLGIVLGPSVLGWVTVDVPIEILAVTGLAFLLFASGLEVELDHLRGRFLRLPLLGTVISVALGLAIGALLAFGGQVRSPLLIAITLSATSLGIVVPVLKDAGESDSDFGQLVIASATIADIAAIVLLTLFFSGESSGPGATLTLLAAFALAVAALGASLGWLGARPRIAMELVRLQDTTAQIRVRGAIVVVMGLVALAGRFGLETILGAFLAGVLLSRLDSGAISHPNFRRKLDALSFGFLVPVFFVTSGLQFDLRALLERPAGLLLVPLFLVALAIVRGLPALLYRPIVDSARTIAAGLLQATSLPVIVTATMIGESLGLLTPATSAALVAAGLLSVLLFPLLALTVLPDAKEPARNAAPLHTDDTPVTLPGP